ncbi:hypothetical protein M9Y10_005415 [Tritrichomonas musculus]|uniref:PDEase domain-containing protein n=1 Tax=Tritrichomonas musculus TaxID=1915356 RepID=A0ABR2JN71_9EUKA
MNRSFRSSFRKNTAKSKVSHIISRPQPTTNQALTKHSYVINSTASTICKGDAVSGSTSSRVGSSLGPDYNSQSSKPLFDTDQLIDSFIEKAASHPLYQCVELFLKEKFNVKSVIYWQEIPNAQVLYSYSLNLSNDHSSGIVGNCYFQRQIMRIPNASAHPSYSSRLDGKISQPNASLLLFPLFDWRNTLSAVCEIIRDNNNAEFTIEDEIFAKWFQKKFKNLSRWLKHPVLMSLMPSSSNYNNSGSESENSGNSARLLSYDDTLIHDIMQLTDRENFIINITKKLTANFDCRAFEIWKYEKKGDKIFRFNEPIDPTEAGIVGDSLTRDQTINCMTNKMSSSYNPKIDGEAEESILSIPVIERGKADDDNIIFSVVIRGSQHHIFTKDDEDALKHLAPFILLAYSNAEAYSNVNTAFNTSRIEQESLAALLEVVELLSSQLDTDKLTDIILEKGRQLTNSDRCSLFLLSEDKESLSSYYQTGLKTPIVIPATNGIAGKTLKEKKVLIIPDAYDTDFFDSTTDKQTGYRTKSILSVPIYSNHGEVIGVTEMMNKKPKPGESSQATIGFTEWDCKVIQIFNIFCGISLENARLFKESVGKTSQLTMFFNTAFSLSKSEDIHRLLSDILNNAKESVEAERAAIFLIDETQEIMTSFIVDGDKFPKQLPMSIGIAAAAAKKKKGILENDVYHCPEFNRSIDAQTGYKTRSIIATPVISPKGEVLGVVEMLNKTSKASKTAGFQEKDLETLNAFSTFVSVALQNSHLKEVALHGDVEVEMSKYITESERLSNQVPSKLALTEAEKTTVRSLNCFAPDFKGIGHFKELYYFFSIWNLLEKFKVSNEQFFRFIFTMRRQYTNTSYHNWTHACDVSQYVTYQMLLAKADQYLNSDEIFIILTAAICHDANHEGLNNVYNVKAETPLGILFKDTSVMEMHHITVAIPILLRTDINMFGCFDETESKKMWTLFIRLILATDMAHHFELVKKNQALWDDNEFSWDEPEHRLLAMQLLIKVADISNVSRPFEYADKWCDILNEEFFKQGDLEKSSGIGLTSPLNDREHPDKPKSQIGFYNFICLPLYSTIARIFPELQVNADSVKANLEVWKSLAAANEAKKKEEEEVKKKEEEEKKKKEEEEKEKNKEEEAPANSEEKKDNEAEKKEGGEDNTEKKE